MKSLLAAPRVLTSLAVASFALLVTSAIWNRPHDLQVLMLALLAMTALGALASPVWFGALATLIATFGLYLLVLVTLGNTALLTVENAVGAGALLLSAVWFWLLSRQIYRIEYDATRQRALVDSLTIYDQQTGAIRAGHLVELLTYEVARARRYNEPLTVAAVQLEDPPRDGPTARDMRRKLSALFLAKLRTVDRVGFGMENECLLLLPNTSQEQADLVAGRLVHMVYEQLAVNIIIGLATFPEDGAGSETLLHEAHAALEFGHLNSIPVVSPRLFGREQQA